jgi:hypothetical protein
MLVGCLAFSLIIFSTISVLSPPLVYPEQFSGRGEVGTFIDVLMYDVGLDGGVGVLKKV